MRRRGELPGVPINGHGETPIFRAKPPETNGKRLEARRPVPVLDSIREIQATQGSFIHQGRGGDDRPQGVVGRMMTETHELYAAVEGGDRAEIAGELADVFLLMTRVAHEFTIPLEVAISDKIARNAAKYPPAEMEAMRKDGYSSDEVEAHLKGRWDKTRDTTEFSRLQSVRAELADLTGRDAT